MSKAISNPPPGAAEATQPAARQTQVAALCLRENDEGSREVLLITSRGTGRWIVPKGWEIDGLSPSEAALQEAWEEAGVKGSATSDQPIGFFDYDKWLDEDTNAPIQAQVFKISVEKLARKYPESGQRRRKWFSPEKAARKVQEPQLQKLLKKL